MTEIIIAHLLGDWIFQSRKMAVEKGKNKLSGWLYCLIHVSIYTAWFIVLVPGRSFDFYASIFIPHFIIDKFSLVSYWQRLRDGYFWWQSYQKELTDQIAPFDRFMIRIEWGFAALRYAVEDNSIHLICLYLSYKFLP